MTYLKHPSGRPACLVTACLVTARLVTAALLLAAPVAHAAIGDFNGDGIGDVAIGVPNEAIVSSGSNRLGAGAVSVIYGSSANGLVGAQVGTPSSQLWHQDIVDIADAVEANDLFGEGIAVGDFNGDGFDDLAVAVRGDNAIQIINGSPTGLVGAGSRLIRCQDIDDGDPSALSTIRVGGTRVAGGSIAMNVGDFDHNGVDDLVFEGNAFVNGGRVSDVVVLFGHFGVGPASGISAFDSTLLRFTNNTNGSLAGEVKVALAVGDVDVDGDDDLAVGLPFADISIASGQVVSEAGTVAVVLAVPSQNASFPGRTVLDLAGRRTLTQATGNPEPFESGDKFGSALAMADFNGDGRADLAVGAAFDDRGLNSFIDEGAVSVFSGAQTFQSFWTQNVLNQPRESGDNFGLALAAADFNGDGRADLAIGQPGDHVDQSSGDEAGAVSVVYGGATGLGLTNGPGNQYFVEGTVGGLSRVGERFGAALSAGNIGRSAHADLVVGAPGENVTTAVRLATPDCSQIFCISVKFETHVGAGQLNTIYGSASGLTSLGAQSFTQSSTSIPDSPEAGDAFGGTQ